MNFLIADDEQLVRLTIQKILNDYGIENKNIVHACTGEEMLNVLASNYIDIALVDIRMPGITGLEAIRRGLQISGHTSFYIITGYDRFEYAREAVSIGVKDFLLKPLESRYVEEILRREHVLRETARRSSRKDFASIVSPVLLTGNSTATEEFFCLPLLCTFDNTHVPELDIFYRCEDIFPSVSTVILPFPAKAYVIFCSRRRFAEEKPLMTHIQTLSTSTFSRPGWDTATVFAASANIPLSGLKTAFQKLEHYAAVRLTHGLQKFYSAASSRISEPDGLLRIAGLILDMKTDYALGSYVDYMNHLEKMRSALKQQPSLSKAALKNVNAWLNACFYRHNQFFNTPDEFYGYFLSLSGHLITPSDSGPSSLEQIIRYVDARYSTDISINGLADKFGLTPNYLSAQFKKETGLKFTDYITNLRMAHAKKLLLESDRQVKQIAAEAGYYTASHFIKAFVKHENMTPMEFRKLHKNTAKS